MALRGCGRSPHRARVKIFPLEWGSDWMQSITLEAGGQAPSIEAGDGLSFSSPQFMIKG
jgi:hypothetical protein